MATSTTSGIKTIEEYLANVSEEQRVALQKLRESIHALVPEATECISYQLPAFRTKRLLVGFGATKSHCAFYLMSGSTVEAFKEELKGYDTSKGTIRFQAESPLPDELVKRLVEARLAEIGA